MNIQLIHGQFSKKEAIELITQMIHVKIKFHESIIGSKDNEEDIKMREKRIKQLQKDLFETRKYIEQREDVITLNAQILI